MGMNVLPAKPDALKSFAPETDLTTPLLAGHPAHAPLASDMPFIIHDAHVPLGAMRAARGRARRALTALALIGTAGWAAYEYRFTPSIDLGTIAAWAADLAIPEIPASRPIKALPLDPEPNDLPPASSESAGSTSEAAVSMTAGRAAAPGSDTAVATVAEVTQPTATPPQSAGTSGSLVSPVHSVSGVWRMDTQTEASDSSLTGLQLHYEVTLAQEGDQVTGSGTKVSDDGGAGAGARTPVAMSGTVAGERLTLNFVEGGSGSETRGKIVLVIDNAGTLRGRFSSNAVPSTGHVEGRRVSSSQ
jgi:hypothetical protein